MKNLKNYILIFTILGLFNSCAKDGAPGPTGPTGPQGPTGNANVQSQTFTVTNWTLSSTPSYQASITDNEITQAILNNGTISAFWADGTGGWIPLPVTVPTTTGISSQTWAVDFGLNTIDITVVNNDYSTPSNPGSQTFKIVATAGQ
jgi:hypothetical protein